jgi:tRNA threonylcarbamoyladenosine biosynthesis protein TsaB
MELSIDTSTRYASVGLSRQGEEAVQLTWRSEQNHSAEFVPAFKQVMERAKVDIDGIDAVFVARGPGGFSALRVGVSLAKALAVARSIPLVAVGTLEIEAHPYLGLGLPVCALIEAGRSMVYTAMFGPGRQTSDGEYSVKTHHDLVSSIRGPTLFCGEAAGTLAGLLRDDLGETAMLPECQPPTRKPGVLARLGYRRLLASDTDDPETLQPLYMRGGQFDSAQRRTGTA